MQADELQICVYVNKQRRHAVALRGALELGRQKPGEPPPFAKFAAGSRERMIIAAKDEDHISREQAR